MQEIKLFDTIEDVNAFLGITSVGAVDLSWVQPQHQKAILAVNHLFNVHEAHNRANNFVADWVNARQSKFNVWQWIKANKKKASGFGFSTTLYDDWNSDSAVGSRLSVGTLKEAIHIGTKFEYLYEDLFFIEPVA